MVSIAHEINLKPLDKKIISHLRSRGSISPLEAFATYGTMRLAARIFDLRKVGYDIESVLKKDEENTSYTRYYLHNDLRAAA